jgi:4-hydroxy-tetrahydrodipicolinate synthase
MQDNYQHASGVYTICPTPFNSAGGIDVGSIHSMVRFQTRAGVTGLAVLGFMGEAHKLSGRERREVISAFVEAAATKLPVWVGVRALGTAGAIEQAQEAQELGASAVFVAPLDGAADAGQFEYYRAVSEAIGIPVVIHDFPASFGTELSPEVVARLGTSTNVTMIKLEEPPVGQKLSKIRELAGDRMKIFGGLGGVSFIEELQRGAVGTMTGFAFPEILVEIYTRFRTGDHAGAAQVFDRYCSLMRYEFQPLVGLALRKYVYMRRGVIASDSIRSPGMRLDETTRAELEGLVRRLGLDLRSHEPLIVSSAV